EEGVAAPEVHTQAPLPLGVAVEESGGRASDADVDESVRRQVRAWQSHFEVVAAECPTASFGPALRRLSRISDFIQGEDGERAAHLSVEEPLAFLADDASDFLAALARHATIHLARARGRGSARSRRIGEDVEVGKRQRFDEAQAGGMVLVRLAREAYHDVGAEAAIRDLLVNGEDALAILAGPVTAVHQAQNPVAAALQGNVEMPGEAWLAGRQVDEFRGDVHWLDRADAQA